MNQSHGGSPQPVGADTAAASAGAALHAEFREQRAVGVPISRLSPGESPRLNGLDMAHVVRLAEIATPLPPILVDRRSMRVVDGMHRVFAALLNGRQEIDVEFFEGAGPDAFLRAVRANTTHGLPLSSAERRAAAERIVASHPQLSDRAIATAVGLAARTVASIRARSTDAGAQLNTRVGRDGKVRPLSAAEGRRRAAELITERPQASLREVARSAGVSPATAADVRRRLRCGEEPVAEGSRPPGGRTVDVLVSGRGTVARGRRPQRQDPADVVGRLLRDPSLRGSEEGRHLLCLLRSNAIEAGQWSELTAAVPPDCEEQVARLARQYARTWLEFSRQLGERARWPAPAAADEEPGR
ncbi:ParB N-terminal domain-containing protein [Kitasatospora nipponensis]|uniref:ParB N-terminal domain-containing protein n=1 Tax=Kitasatospora nipponensis TaxID=258049 RepID=A0ABP4H425_9ACTN